MVLTPIFSVASIVFGLYLLISYFTSTSSSSSIKPANQHYHLGCFLSQHKTSHSSALIDKISALEQQIRGNISLNMYHSQALGVPDDFHDKSVKLAFEIETFISNYFQTKESLKNYVQLATGVRKAYQEYSDCERQISLLTALDEKDCLRNWEKYKSCTGDLEALKSKLGLLFQAKEKITEQIEKLLKNDASPDKNPEDSDSEMEYKKKLRELEDKEKRIEIELKNLNEKISTKQYYISTLWNDAKHAAELYRQCSENRKEFKLCEEISKQVLNIGDGEIQKLNLWLVNKFKNLNRLQKMIQTGSSAANLEELKTLFKKGTVEYQEMLKLFIETKVKMSKHCGCSEEQEKKLKENAEAKKAEAEQKQLEIIKLKRLYEDHQKDLRLVGLEKEKLFKEYQERINNITAKAQTQKVDKIKALKALNEQQREIDAAILEYEAQFYSLEQGCEEYQQKLRMQLSKIQKIKGCAGKLHYYTHLVHRLKKEEPKEIANDKVVRQRLKNMLEAYKM